MNLDPVLLDILVCPDCKGSLTVDYDSDELICNQCGLVYPVRDNIPIMLVDEARRPESPQPSEPPQPPEPERASAPPVTPQQGDDAGRGRDAPPAER